MTGTRELRIAPAIVRMESTRPARRIHLDQQSRGALAVGARNGTLKQSGADGLNRVVENQLFDQQAAGRALLPAPRHTSPDRCNQAEELNGT